MKQTKWFAVAFSLGILGGFSFTSCSDDDYIQSQNSSNGDGGLNTVVLDSTVYSVEEYADMVYGADDGSNSGTGALDARAKFIAQINESNSAVASGLGMNGSVGSEFVRYNFKYEGKNWNDNRSGSTDQLGGAVMWRRFYTFDTSDPTKKFVMNVRALNNVYLVEHEQLTRMADMPSKNDNYLMPNIMSDLLIIPDHASNGLYFWKSHPFYCNDQNAQNALKAYYAAMEVFKDRAGEQGLPDSHKMYAVGVGEGAGTAMALHKYLDTNTSVGDAVHFAGSICCGGIYDLRGTFDKWIEDDVCDQPILIPLIIKSVVRLHFLPGGEKACFSEKYQGVMDEIDNMIEVGKNSMEQLNSKLKELMGLDEVKPSDLLSADVLQNPKSGASIMLNHCLDSEKYDGWTPVHPTVLIHSLTDRIAPILNAEHIRNVFNGNARFSFSSVPAEYETKYPSKDSGTQSGTIAYWYNNTDYKWQWNSSAYDGKSNQCDEIK